jgi:ankyrin repeat protein
LLLDHGANVKAATKEGVTPLFVAAFRPGNSSVIRLLLSKGADPATKLLGVLTPLDAAAIFGDLTAMRLLLDHGANAVESSCLARSAAAGHCQECLELALARGASPNGAFLGRSALQDAAAFGSLDMVRLLVDKGADIQAADQRGYTALMRGVLSYEPGSARAVEYLLAKGARTDPKNETAETALSLALRFGDTPIVAMLRRAGAPEARTANRVAPPLAENNIHDAIVRSLPLLQRIGEPVYKLRHCTSCHNNSLPALTVSMAHARGFKIDVATARQEYESSITTAQGLLNPDNVMGFGLPDGSPYTLIGIAAESATPNPSTDGMVHQLSTRQELSGRFQMFDYRPPMEYTAITFTATALRAMQLFALPGRAAEFKDRIQRASRWLAAQAPRDTEEHALRLMGLSWAGAKKPVLSDATHALIALQRQDGGWAQSSVLSTDAYATGESLYALHLAGVSANSAPYQRGIDFLLKTQRQDGSWYVTSRSHPIQPLFDAGYPYIHHQWISAAGGAWSTLALLATIPQQKTASR